MKTDSGYWILGAGFWSLATGHRSFDEIYG